MAHWFMQLHHALRWWAPGVLAACVYYAPWVLLWPWRNSEWYEEFMGGALKRSFYALVAFYLMWFALPHPGTEILLMIIVLLYSAVLVGALLIAALMNCYDAWHDWENKRRKAKGLPYNRWKEELVEQQAELRAFEEREALLRGEVLRKRRFGVVDGGREVSQGREEGESS